MMKFKILIGIFSIATLPCFAQSKFEDVFIKKVSGIQMSKVSDQNNSFNALLNLNNDYTYSLINKSGLKDDLGLLHYKSQQYYKGIKVEHSILNVHSKNNEVISFNGAFANFLNVETSAKLTEKEALDKALRSINATKYLWQDEAQLALLNSAENNKNTLPKGELVICRNYKNTKETEFRLAYKFDIYALEPLSRDFVYVDANTGEVIYKDAIIKDAFVNKSKNSNTKNTSSLIAGTAQNRYSGSQTIETTAGGGGYQLRDYIRGLGIETYNLNHGTTYVNTNFTDNDNNWTAAEWHNANKDDAALDAHWGAERTYDYFWQKHGRNSVDNAGKKLLNYVHYSTNYFNAFWNGSSMTYGDGSSLNGYNPLTALDVAGHEIGHGVCTYSANLTYSYEPGALNESFSDIWGAAVEYFSAPTKQTWEIGDDIGYIIRSMANPNSHSQPDTYLGTYWYTGTSDYGGVHTNSGVQNFWFYLLSKGGSGTNDFGTSYYVAPIGIEKAAKIAYRTETVYLGPSSNYANARTYSIQAAIDLYGANSAEAVNTERAWCAVGVGTCTTPPALNLYVGDRTYDTGIEPNPDTGPMWISENIWVSYPTANGPSVNPEYTTISPNYVNVRVNNKATTASSYATLAVYYAKASTGLTWPTHFNNYYQMVGSNNVLHGDFIGSVAIPSIPAGGSTIVSVPWFPPNPANYVSDVHHFCLVARILAPNDPMYNEQNNVNVGVNAKNNNNVAWKNVQVYDTNPNNFAPPTNVFIRGINEKLPYVNIRFLDGGFKDPIKRKFFDLGGQITLELEPKLFEIAVRNNSFGEGIKVLDKNQVLVYSPLAQIKNLPLQFGETYSIKYSFKTEALLEPGEQVLLDVVQENVKTGELEGGERFTLTYSEKTGKQAVITSNNLSDESKVNVLPNPNNGIFKISTKDLASGKIQVLDVKGSVVTEFAFKNQKEIEVNISNAISGVYFIHIIMGDKIIKKAVIKK